MERHWIPKLKRGKPGESKEYLRIHIISFSSDRSTSDLYMYFGSFCGASTRNQEGNVNVKASKNTVRLFLRHTHREEDEGEDAESNPTTFPAQACIPSSLQGAPRSFRSQCTASRCPAGEWWIPRNEHRVLRALDTSGELSPTCDNGTYADCR